MSKIARKAAQIFGSNAGVNQIGQFGSKAAGVPAYTTDPDVIQSLSQYLGGWYTAVLSGNSPAIQDMNALCYLFAYQIAYLMQTGIAEWNAGTTYYIGSMVTSNSIIYVSLTDTNLNNAVSSAANWISLGSTNVQTFTTDSTWVAPNGCASVQVLAKRTRKNFDVADFVLMVGATSPNGSCVLSWGNNAAGQLGQNVSPLSSAATSSPVIVVNPFATGPAATQVKCNTNQNGFAVTANGRIYAWGSNPNGQLGIGNVTTVSSPTLVLSNFAARKVYSARGSNSAYAVSTGGQCYAWGDNTNGQLGLGDVIPRSSPVVVLTSTVFRSLVEGDAIGTSWTMGLDTTGAAFAWGVNTSGQLGLGDATPRSSPVAVLGAHVFTKLAAGASCAFGIDSAGALWSWGLNTNGELGLGDVTARSSPVAVLGGHVFTDIVVGTDSGGGNSILALDSAGALWGWGANTKGQLGVNDALPHSSPVAVVGAHTFSKMALSVTSFAYGIDTAGALWAWGLNSSGQLGNNGTVSASSPVAVVGGLSFSSVYPNSDATIPGAIAIDQGGKLYALGGGAKGEAGLNGAAPVSSPTVVAGVPILKMEPDTGYQVIPVTPGTTYTISLTTFYARFGNSNLLAGGADTITLKW